MSEKRKDSKGRVLRNGEVQRSDGKYMFRYTDRNGKRHTIYSWKLVSTDKVPEGKKCDAALRDMIQVIQKDLLDDIRTYESATITVDDLFRSFMDMRVNLRETTRCTYTTLYQNHVSDVIGHRTLRSVRCSDVQKMYTEMIHTTGLKFGTVEKINTVLCQMFNMAVLDNIIRANPAWSAFQNVRKNDGEEPEKRHALTEEEQSILLRFVYTSRQFRRWAPLITVLLGTGMRIGEALGLRWDDCDFEKGIISVNHILLYKEREEDGKYEYRISDPKTNAGKRLIPMISDVKKTLLEIKKVKRPKGEKKFVVDGYKNFIFLNNNGKVFTPGAVFEALKRIVNAYNRNEFFLAEEEDRPPAYLPNFSAHILRHTFCTRYCENESNVKLIQDVMGHQHFSTTMDVYTEATTAKKQSSIQSLEGKIVLSY